MKKIATLLATAGFAIGLTAAVAMASAAHTASSHAVVGTRSTSLGTVLVGTNGDTLYLSTADSKNKSNCTGSCATTWPPLTTKGSPKAKGSAKSSDLGTITRSGGVKQVTYKHHPLYYFVSDTAAGQTTGEGVGGFYVVSTKGSAITKATKQSTSTSSGW
jgi:predicted lipoprotein with Yx(FWY)xxD motif